MADITVTLTSAQVQQGLVYARKVFPDATNADLLAKLTEAATHGPGVYPQIGEWEAIATRQTENENRQVSRDEFLAVFPPPPDPDAVAEQLPAAKTTAKRAAAKK